MASSGSPLKVAHKIGSEVWPRVNPLIFQGLSGLTRFCRNPDASSPSPSLHSGPIQTARMLAFVVLPAAVARGNFRFSGKKISLA